MINRNNLALGSDSNCHLHQEISEEARNEQVFVKSFEQFQKEDGVEETQTSLISVIMLFD